ncbi:MAG TPA: IS1595 family transposase [Paenibacillus sp.]|nr:IS1595 family transposase [Paenibacillus sp.]
MNEAYEFLFRKRWPDGFECPGCGCKRHTVVTSRKLPLYQCGQCRRQTSLPSDTAMAGSRPPLEKWHAAIRLLSETEGVNTEQLADGIGVTYKTAWSMMQSIRISISSEEAERPLNGSVFAGVAYADRWHYQPFILYPGERVVIVAASVDPSSGKQTAVKLHVVPRRHLTDYKEIMPQGIADFEARCVHRSADYTFHPWKEMHNANPLVERFKEARRWLNARARGLTENTLQSYFDEYCFRHRVAAEGGSLAEELYRICLRKGRPPTPAGHGNTLDSAKTT